MMRCPTLSELPPPPAGRSGWPWTVASAQLADVMPDGKPWPRISIVTPSYNQGQFIEETIRSILLQGYPDLEYIIMDGASADNSVDVIRKYEPWLTYCISEEDRGQAHAINKGFGRHTGLIFQWINSDDFLTEGALSVVAQNCPPNGILGAGMQTFGIRDRDNMFCKNMNIDDLVRLRTSFVQPGLWLSAPAAATCFPLDECLHFAFDLKMLWDVLIARPEHVEVPNVIVNFRHHSESKTISLAHMWEKEGEKIYEYLLSNEKYNHIKKSIQAHRGKTYARRRINSTNSDDLFAVSYLFIRSVIQCPSVIRDRYMWGAIRKSLQIRVRLAVS